MPEDIAKPDESVADESVEKSLGEHLAEWDHRSDESEGLKVRDDEEISEFESRISTLEGENSELTERAEMAEGIGEFIDGSLERIDQHDFARAADRIARETGLSDAAAERELKLRMHEDPEFLAAADARFDSPEEFESVLESMVDDLQEKYPPSENPRHIAHAVRIARASHGSAGDYSQTDYPDLAPLNDREFAVASQQIFEDMKSGKLKPESGSRGDGCIR